MRGDHNQMKFLIKCLIALATIGFFTSNVFGDDDLLKRYDVATAIGHLKHDAFGPFHIEAVLEILEVSDLSTEFVYIGGSGIEVQLPPIPKEVRLKAIIHCHPDAAFPKPSSQDELTAKSLQVPVYTISRTMTWVSLPNGTSKEVKETN